MPTYEYACKSCGNQWEEIQKISEPALDECPKCHEKSAQRLISQGNFILKGGGWYTTGGYGSPAKSKGDSESSSSSSSSSASGSSGSSAPAATSTTGDAAKSGSDASSSSTSTAPAAAAKSESSTPAKSSD